MIVYNITVKINAAIEADWLKWQKEEHIPEILATQQFSGHQLFKLLEIDDSDGITYIIQYFATDIEHYHNYINQHASLLQKKAFIKWGNQFIAFRTVMQVVH